MKTQPFKAVNVGLAALAVTLLLTASAAIAPNVANAANAANPAAVIKADETPKADKLELGLQGAWRGALEYRDYQSGSKFELPMTVQIDVGLDNATITRLSTFDDGPVTGMVYITTVSLFDKTGSRVTNAVFRKGRAVDVWADESVVTTYKDATHWTVVYQHKGIDNEKPAEIRVTQTLNGAELVTLKEVKPVGAADKDYLFRNQVRLVRK